MNIFINQVSRKTSVYGSDHTLFEFDRNSGLIFVGGVAKSGSSLVRSILDDHPVFFIAFYSLRLIDACIAYFIFHNSSILYELEMLYNGAKITNGQFFK